jgi:hypothetical protein
MKLLSILLFCLATSSAALASPGAHGPNGEHHDAPGGSVQAASGPRIETFTESFELLGQLYGDELSVLIDRYETNEPVLNATLEVEFNGLKAPAKFHSDHGDYAINDAKMLQALAKPGKHSLVFTLTATGESDLLEGTLEVKGEDASHGHSHEEEHGHSHALSLKTWAIIGLLLCLVLVAMVIPMLRRQSNSGK